MNRAVKWTLVLIFAGAAVLSPVLSQEPLPDESVPVVEEEAVPSEEAPVSEEGAEEGAEAPEPAPDEAAVEGEAEGEEGVEGEGTEGEDGEKPPSGEEGVEVEGEEEPVTVEPKPPPVEPKPPPVEPKPPPVEPKPPPVEPKPPPVEPEPETEYPSGVTYWPEYRCAAKLDFGLFPPRFSARPSLTDDNVSLSPILDKVALSVAMRFELATPTKKVYSAEFWSLDSKSGGTLAAATQWGGGTFSAGENVIADAEVRYYNLSYGTTLLDYDTFRFGIFLGLDMVDVDMRLSSTSTAERGRMSKFVPTPTVGFDLLYYPYPEWGIYGRTTGLSWSDLLGIDMGVFAPSGNYQAIEVGAVWRPTDNFQAMLGYRRFVLRYDNTDEAMSVRLNGAFIGASYEW